MQEKKQKKIKAPPGPGRFGRVHVGGSMCPALSIESEIPRHTECDGGSAGKMKKLFGIYFGGYSEDISEDFVSSFEEHSRLCDEKDGTKGRK